MTLRTAALAGMALVAVVVLAACDTYQTLRVGDCIDADRIEGKSDKIPCEDPHSGTVSAVFQMENDEFPGLEAASRQAQERCSSHDVLTGIIYPNESTWALGQRQLACFLPVIFDLRVDDCLVLVLDTQRVSCSKPHDARVIAFTEVPGTNYPGQEAIIEYGFQNCPADTDNFLFPKEDHWSLGFRSISCLDETTP